MADQEDKDLRPPREDETAQGIGVVGTIIILIGILLIIFLIIRGLSDEEPTSRGIDFEATAPVDYEAERD